ncbi:hypothetical protein, partial [Motilibacter deserti]
FLVGGLSDREPGAALRDMHAARCDVLGLHGPLRALDRAWAGGLTAYVLARREAKRTARRVGGTRAVDWWAGRRRPEAAEDGQGPR